ncbi:hypothetical protein FA13DRAFT_653802 [Coprinellus micaceus]|uniref:Uncharacterized protein n=1 Tax=Coprinellus micaceus TaxID=71717 RepID=A0A4Y7SAA3_COPMI|nr:hypothetical protein FA13DRAFT_653802 [Coprinellus micaceus]
MRVTRRNGDGDKVLRLLLHRRRVVRHRPALVLAAVPRMAARPATRRSNVGWWSGGIPRNGAVRNGSGAESEVEALVAERESNRTPRRPSAAVAAGTWISSPSSCTSSEPEAPAERNRQPGHGRTQPPHSPSHTQPHSPDSYPRSAPPSGRTAHASAALHDARRCPSSKAVPLQLNSSECEDARGRGGDTTRPPTYSDWGHLLPIRVHRAAIIVRIRPILPSCIVAPPEVEEVDVCVLINLAFLVASSPHCASLLLLLLPLPLPLLPIHLHNALVVVIVSASMTAIVHARILLSHEAQDALDTPRLRLLRERGGSIGDDASV